VNKLTILSKWYKQLAVKENGLKKDELPEWKNHIIKNNYKTALILPDAKALAPKTQRLKELLVHTVPPRYPERR
jgi:hypothetical protein